MEIERKNTTKFGSLKAGDVFFYDGKEYMIVDQDFGLGADIGYDGYAVSLDNGWLYGFDNDEEVIKVSAKLTITN